MKFKKIIILFYLICLLTTMNGQCQLTNKGVIIDTLLLEKGYVLTNSNIPDIIDYLKNIHNFPFFYKNEGSKPPLKHHISIFKSDLNSDAFAGLKAGISCSLERYESDLDDDYLALFEFHFDSVDNAKKLFNDLDKYNDFFGGFHTYPNWVIAIDKNKVLIVESLSGTLNHVIESEIIIYLKIRTPKLVFKLRR